ncbi:885_t:CDS:2, partial [Gigaspora rosea]
MDKEGLSNKLLVKELKAELESEDTPMNWNRCKLRSQSIIRAFRKSKQHESNIFKINNTVSKLKEEKAKKGLSSVKEDELANLINKLHEETAALADKSEGNCKDLIKVLKEYKDKYEDTLDYIKEEYKNIYRKEKWDPQLADNLTTDLPQVSTEMNSSLMKHITKEEIEQTIKSLPNNKSP